MYVYTENMWKVGSLLILVISAVTADDHGSTAVSHTAETFASQVEETKHFVMFFAPWCGHCKRLAPTWNELAKLYNEKEEKEVIIAKVDCTTDTALCAENDVTGYPTIKFFPNGKEGAIRYKGVRDLNALQDFVEEQLDREPEFAPEDKQAGERPPEGPLYDLNDENFAEFTQTGYHFIKFFAPWCGHCKRLAPTWEDLARLYAEDETVYISKVDCTQSQQLCTSHGVRGYPTLLLFKDGQKVEQYPGQRDLDAFKSYLNKMVEQKDEKVESEEEKVPEKKPDDEALKEGEKPAEGPLYDLNDENFAKFTQTGYHFIKFFAPWCGHCKRLAPVWEDLAKLFADDKAVSIVKADASAEIAEIAIGNAKETAQVAKSAVEDANESAQVAKSAVEDANEAAQAAKSAVEDANETAQFTDDADTDTAQIVDDIVDAIDDIANIVVNVVNAIDDVIDTAKTQEDSGTIDTAKIPEDSGTTYKLDGVTSTSDKGNNYNYFGKDTGKGINLTDVFISNDIDGILIVQYPEEAQYIGEPHANGLLENATQTQSYNNFNN